MKYNENSVKFNGKSYMLIDILSFLEFITSSFDEVAMNLQAMSQDPRPWKGCLQITRMTESNMSLHQGWHVVTLSVAHKLSMKT